MRPLALIVALTLGSTAGLACAHAGGFTPADRAAITDLLHDQQDAWNRGDLEGFLRGYERSPDLLFTSGGKVRRGFAATRARYRARYLGIVDDTGTPTGDASTSKTGASIPSIPSTPSITSATSKMGTLELEVRDVRGLGRDGAIVLGRWRLTDTPESGAGVFSLAFFRTRDGWRIVHDHTSLATP